MKLDALKEVAELVGIAAIVASLVFVGLQLRQAQEIAIADQYQERSNAAVDWYSARMQSDTSLESVARRLSANDAAGSVSGVFVSFGDDDPHLVAQRYLEFRANMTFFDNYHFQYERGFLPEDAWLAFRVRLTGLLKNAFNTDIYRQQRTQYRESFRRVCDEILADEIDAP